MSLINDALKRTTQNQKDAGAGQSGGGTPMTPADNSPGSGPNFVLIGLLLLCLAGGGYYFMKWKEARDKGGQTKTAPPKVAATTNGILGAAALIRQTTNLVGQISGRQGADTTMQQPARSTNVMTQARTNVASGATTAAESTNAETASTSVPVSPAPAEPVKLIPSAPSASGPFPTLKLQGIFYRLKNPTVLINGETMKIGDTIGGAKLVEINRMDAKVEWNGQTKVLPLPPE